MEDWRYYKKTPAKLPVSSVDMDCLKLEWQKEIASITVDEKSAQVTPKNQIVVYCPWAIPCLLDSARPAFPQ